MFDGYSSIAFKHAGKVHLRSRNNKDFNARYPAIVSALTALPDETVIDREIVAFSDHCFERTYRSLGRLRSNQRLGDGLKETIREFVEQDLIHGYIVKVAEFLDPI